MTKKLLNLVLKLIVANNSTCLSLQLQYMESRDKDDNLKKRIKEKKCPKQQ